MKLTKRTIDATQPDPDRDVFLWDEETRGFGVRVKPSGVKTYIVQYRNSQGRQRRYALGRHGVLTPDEARKRAREALSDVSRGADPSAQRKIQKAAPTVGDLFDRLDAEHIEKHLAATTAHVWRYLIKAHIRPALGNYTVAAITRPDIARLHRLMAGTHRQANNALTVLSRAFGLAEIWGLRPEGTNPALKIKRYKEIARDRFLNDKEITRLGAVLRSIEVAGSEATVSLAAIRILLFTGARASEVLTLEWRHVDFKKGMVAFPGVKGGDRVWHPVSAPVLAVLAEQPKIDSVPWVLPMPTDQKHHLEYYALARCWQRVRKSAGLEDVKLHDLRHTVGTFAGQAGGNAFLVRDVLRHRTVAMTSRYANRDNDPVRELSDRIGGRITAALAKQEPSQAEVVPLKKGKPREPADGR